MYLGRGYVLLTVPRGVRRHRQIGRAVGHGAVGGKHSLSRRDIRRVSGAVVLCRRVNDLADGERVLVLEACASRQ